MKLRRFGIPLILAVAAYFAVFGGEYSIFDVQRLQERRVRESAQLEQVHAEIERLKARAEALASDSAALERIARERYGMIREGERLYRFVTDVPSGRAEPEAPPLKQASAVE